MSPRTFNLICSIAGLAFLLLSQGVKWVQYDRQHLPQTQDFDQYYMGGVIARHGAWTDLYPIPRAGMNPGEPENSTMRPRYAELARQYGFDELGGGTRYMQPPPFALLLVPLTFLPIRIAHALWIVLLCFATWGIARQSARAYALCAGRIDFVPGLIILFICVSLQAHRWTRVGNMSAMIGWLVGYIGLSIASDRQGVRPAIAMVIAGLAKYVSAIFVPIHVAARHWRTLIWTLAIGSAFVLLTLPITGVQPYRTFATEIAPTLGRPVIRDQNVSVTAFLHRVLDVDVLPPSALVGLRVARLVLLLIILVALFSKPFTVWRIPARACAASVAMLCWLLMFSPILWEHYFAYLAPFYGWMIFEALHARGRAALLISPAVAVALLLAWFPQKVFGARHVTEPINSFLLWSIVLMMTVALWRMFRRDPVTS
ncbi:MAG: DUF2029 domain-containing protein [Anaerolineae bacterium]|nr:DUF2029 domain-containing protein [Phycisphaerae bacterium]